MSSLKTDGFENPVSVLKRHGLAAKKSWGQNFLVSQSAVKKITKECTAKLHWPVLEIGAGLGTLTGSLLHAGAVVIAIEQDPDMCKVLKEEFKNNSRFTLHSADAATFNYGTVFSNAQGVIAGNLPYQITGAILRRIMDVTDTFGKAVFMVQEEAADRICADTKTRNRGALSVMTDVRFKSKIVMRLKPTAFHPPPKVRSAVITLLPRTEPLIDRKNLKNFDTLVKAAFSNRRKTVRNSLVNSNLFTPQSAEDILMRAGISPAVRAEKIETVQFAELTEQARNMGIFNTPEKNPLDTTGEKV